MTKAEYQKKLYKKRFKAIVGKNYETHHKNISKNYGSLMADDLGFVPKAKWVYKKYVQDINNTLEDKFGAKDTYTKEELQEAVRNSGLSSIYSIHASKEQKYGSFALERVKRDNDKSIYTMIRRANGKGFKSDLEIIKTVTFEGTQMIDETLYSVYELNGIKVGISNSPKGGESDVKLLQ